MIFTRKYTLNTACRSRIILFFHELLVLIQHIEIVVFYNTGVDINPLIVEFSVDTRLPTGAAVVVRFEYFSEEILNAGDNFSAGRCVLHGFEIERLMASMYIFLLVYSISIEELFLLVMLFRIGMVGSNKLLSFRDVDARFTLLRGEVIFM